MSSITDILKATGNSFASIAEDGITAGDVSGFVDSGSYTLNALLSGSLFGGFPGNKIVQIASPSGVGKTFLALGAAKYFLEANPTGIAVLFESESAITRQMLVDRGIDVKRLAVVPVTTVQEFKHQALKVIDNYEKIDEKERYPMFFILDSLGMLSTEKEMADSLEGKDTKDMTRAQLIKAAFRVITLRLGRAKVPLVVTNHVYASMCLAAETLVKTTVGLKPISEIEVGDKVYGTTGVQEVEHIFTPEDLSGEGKTFLELEFDDGTKVRCTNDHKFLNSNKEWVCAENLKVGDKFY